MESDEWDFVRNTEPLRPPITEDTIHLLIGLTFTFLPTSRSDYRSKYEIDDIRNGEVYYTKLGTSSKINQNQQPIEGFLFHINLQDATDSSSWPLIDPSTDEVHNYYHF